MNEESVWEYPRPPKLQEDSREIIVSFDNLIIARTVSAIRVLETSHPPAFYIPPKDVSLELMKPCSDNSYCEWKGVAEYWSIIAGEKLSIKSSWSYPNPKNQFIPISGYFSFYPAKVDACYVDGEKVKPQQGNFYGGWITSEIKGPFKIDSSINIFS